MTAAAEALASAQADVKRYVRLTDRWTPLKPHHGQQLFFWHPAPIKVCPSGRRSGKSELGKRKGVLQLIRKRPWPAKILFGAPTHDQARSIFWDDAKALIPPWWVAARNESRMEIRTRWGALLRIAGLDRPQRSEGVPWDWMLIDELASCVPGLLDLHLLPALSTIGHTVSCDLIGVPDNCGPNQSEYERYWELGLQWPKDPNVCSFHWRSDEIIEPEKVAAAKARMDPIEYEQEYGGRFVTSGGKALPSFSTIHISDYHCDYCPTLPLDWTLDFGVGSNSVSLLCQSFRGHVWIMDEIICDRDGSTEVQVIALRERMKMHDWKPKFIRRFGDAAGNSRHSNTGKSDYKIIDEAWGNNRDMPMDAMELHAAPLIKDTLNAVRGRLLTANGQVHLHVHSRCKTLIDNMKNAPWPSKLEEFHCLAALRYYCYKLFGEGLDAFETAALSLPKMGAAKRTA